MTLDALIDAIAVGDETHAEHPLEEPTLDIDDTPTEVELMVLLSGMIGDTAAGLAF